MREGRRRQEPPLWDEREVKGYIRAVRLAFWGCIILTILFTAYNYRYARIAYDWAAGQREKAIGELSALIKEKPESASLYRSRALMFSLLERHDEAISDLNRASELDPQEAATPGEEAVTRLLSEGRLEDAIAFFTEEYEKNPQDKYNLVARGYTYFALGEYEKALGDAKRLTAERDDSYIPIIREWGYLLTGDVLIKEKDYINAEKAYENVINTIRKTASTEGNPKEVEEKIKRHLELNTPLARAYYERAKALERLNRPKEAIVAYKELLRYCPERIENIRKEAEEKIGRLENFPHLQ